MPLTPHDVSAIADYARIGVTDDELAELTQYLNDAIALLDPLLALDLDGVEPTYHPIGDLTNVTRSDSEVEGLTLEEALANARSAKGRSFRVPAILSDGGAA